MSELGEMVPKFEKKLKDRKEFKAREKKEKFKELEKYESSKSFSLGPPSDKYRSNWEDTFGKKRRDPIPGEGPGLASEEPI